MTTRTQGGRAGKQSKEQGDPTSEVALRTCSLHNKDTVAPAQRLRLPSATRSGGWAESAAAGHPAPEAPKTQHAPVQGACTHTNGSPLVAAHRVRQRHSALDRAHTDGVLPAESPAVEHESLRRRHNRGGQCSRAPSSASHGCRCLAQMLTPPAPVPFTTHPLTVAAPCRDCAPAILPFRLHSFSPWRR